MFLDQESQAKVGHLRSYGSAFLTESEEKETDGNYTLLLLPENHFFSWSVSLTYCVKCIFVEGQIDKILGQLRRCSIILKGRSVLTNIFDIVHRTC